MVKPALGRGLGALLQNNPPSKSPPSIDPEQTPVPSSGQVNLVPIDQLQPSKLQPRRHFAQSALEDLSNSIREKGILQPLVTRKSGDHFELIAGERRWRAAQLAGLKEVPILIKEADDSSVLEMMLIENLQRENLNPIEEAKGYSELIHQFELTQEDVATRVGKSRVAVANALRLLRLSDTTQNLVRDGHLSVGHAKVLLGLPDVQRQDEAAREVIRKGLSVRATEEWMEGTKSSRGPSNPSGTQKPSSSASADIHVKSLEEQLRQHFGTKVTLKYHKGKGSLEIRFFSEEEMERIFQLAGFQLDT